MRYKGFILEKVYTIGSDFDYTPNGKEKTRRPKKEDLLYINVLDPMEGNSKWIACDSIQEAKRDIDKFLLSVGMKSNLKSEWKKLEV